MEPARILLTIGGGIAAYKVPELLRALQNKGMRSAVPRRRQRFAL